MSDNALQKEGGQNPQFNQQPQSFSQQALDMKYKNYLSTPSQSSSMEPSTQSQPQQFNMAGSQGSHQNHNQVLDVKNLGPTQIFYQNPQQQNPPQQQQSNFFQQQNQNTTQLLLLELLRQQQQMQGQAPANPNSSFHIAQAIGSMPQPPQPQSDMLSSPSNGGLFGQGFHSAAQLLASAQQQTQQPSQLDGYPNYTQSLQQTPSQQNQQQALNPLQQSYSNLDPTQWQERPSTQQNADLIASTRQKENINIYNPVAASSSMKAPMQADPRPFMPENSIDMSQQQNKFDWHPTQSARDYEKNHQANVSTHSGQGSARGELASNGGVPWPSRTDAQQPDENAQFEQFMRNNRMQAESRQEHEEIQSDMQYAELARSHAASEQPPADLSEAQRQPSLTSAGRASSQAPLNIDDLPVPARSNAAHGKTFEELLEENLAQDPTAQTSPSKVPKTKPKKEFLRRKTQAVVPSQQAPAPKYKYYTDAIDGGSKEQQETLLPPQVAPPSRRTEVVRPPPRPKAESARPKNYLPMPDIRSASPFQLPDSDGEERVEAKKEVKKKPFLKRGAGQTACGRPTSKSVAKPDMEKERKRSEDAHRPGTGQNTKQAPNTRNRLSMAHKMASMDEFTALEEECNANTAMDLNKDENTYGYSKKKRLFDSDSESDTDEEEVQPIINTQANSRASPRTYQQSKQPESRSNIVKKMFYKEETFEKKQAYQKPAANNDDQELNEQMQALVNQKLEQLDKAIDKYNNENDKMQQQKREYDTLIRKTKLEQRELDTMKKQQVVELERFKEEAMAKVRQEKRALESRQKNLSLVAQGTRREKEEIETLRKEVNRLTDEADEKARKTRQEMDRLRKQNQEFAKKNRELQEDLREMEQFRIQMERRLQNEQQTNAGQSKLKQPSFTKEEKSRYTFSNQNGSAQSSSQQIIDIQTHEAQEDYGVFKQRAEAEERQAIDQVSDDLDEEKDLPQEVYQNNQQEEQEPEEGDDDQEADEEEEDFGLCLPKEYHGKTPQNTRVVDQVISHDGKIQRVYANGKKEVIFNNGVKRESFPDGYTIVYFNNEDIKQTWPDQKVVYYFAEAQTTQTTFSDGLQVFKFANQQIEKHFPDGTKEIIFPDGTIKCIFEDGEEESIFPDGTIQRIERSGIKAIEFANGQKDILYPDGTRVREFPDGRVRKTYPDGRTESLNKK